MPNHTVSTLTIKGNKEELIKFKEYAKGRTTYNGKRMLDANRFIPYPKKYHIQDIKAKKNPKLKDGFNSGGYNWCCNNWGTKWGFYDIYLEEEEILLHYLFSTAWSPAFPVLEKMSEMFPDLEFKYTYEDEGGAYAGITHYKGGEVTEEIDTTEEAFKDES